MTTDKMNVRRLAGPAYLIAALMVFIPIMDLFSNMVPIRPGDPAWRYGVIGLGSGFLLTPMLGMVLAVLISVVVNQDKVARAIGWVNLGGAILLVPLGGLFLLDAIQVRGAVLPDALPGFDIGVVKAVVKFGTAIVAFGWLGTVGTKTRVRVRRESEDTVLRPPS
jgi:hypothetical protein